MRTSNALQRLIDSGRGNERLLRSESRFVDGSRCATLKRLAAECGATVDKLQSVRGRGRRRRRGASGSWLELLRELWRNLRVAVGGRNSGDSVAVCRRSMSRAEALYDRALTLALPEGTVALLLDRRNHVRLARAELVAIQF
jgi:uncharacterized protein (TIGR02284 family)